VYARVSTLRGSPDQIDEGIRHTRESVLPRAEELDGYEGAYLLVDRNSGTSVAITLWESEEAMRASEEAANRLRSDAAEGASAEITNVERYEVAISPAERG
jgi:heme-degrading monooxygenase HmoA